MENNMQSKISENLSVESYKNLLSKKEVKLVETKRDIPLWVDELKIPLNKEKVLPLQVWLINEPVDLLNDRLVDNLVKFGFSDEISKFIAKDVSYMVNFFIELTGDKNPFVSLRTIDSLYFKEGEKSVSKDWHIDTAVLTLTCTYSGRGTEWTTNDNPAIRKRFEDEKILKNVDFNLDSNEIHEMGLFEASVLKGEIRNSEDKGSKEFLLNFLKEDEIEPFNINEGLLHRGPGYIKGDGRRLLLTVSTMRIPSWLH